MKKGFPTQKSHYPTPFSEEVLDAVRLILNGYRNYENLVRLLGFTIQHQQIKADSRDVVNACTKNKEQVSQSVKDLTSLLKSVKYGLDKINSVPLPKEYCPPTGGIINWYDDPESVRKYEAFRRQPGRPSNAYLIELVTQKDRISGASKLTKEHRKQLQERYPKDFASKSHDTIRRTIQYYIETYRK